MFVVMLRVLTMMLLSFSPPPPLANDRECVRLLPFNFQFKNLTVAVCHASVLVIRNHSMIYDD